MSKLHPLYQGEMKVVCEGHMFNIFISDFSDIHLFHFFLQPNDYKKSHYFDDELVRHQVGYLGYVCMRIRLCLL